MFQIEEHKDWADKDADKGEVVGNAHALAMLLAVKFLET